MAQLLNAPVLETLTITAANIDVRWTHDLGKIAKSRSKNCFLELKADAFSYQDKSEISQNLSVESLPKPKPDDEIENQYKEKHIISLRASQELPGSLDYDLEEPLSFIVQDAISENVFLPRSEQAYKRFLEYVQASK